MVLVKIERRTFKPLYLLKPSKQFALFEAEVERVLAEFNLKKTSNRALKEVMKRKGWKKIRKMKKKFSKFDSLPLVERKLLYNAFYRVFQRLHWAESAESEREVELKVWITSSIDYLYKVAKLLEERYG
jgi:DTW domain-containing protein YfiP